MEKQYSKSWSVIAITFLSFTFSSVAHSTLYSVSDSGGLSYFDAGGQLKGEPNELIAWGNTPYNPTSLLSLLNTYFAPDFSFGSRWDVALLFDINQTNQAVGTVEYSEVRYGLFLDGSRVSVLEPETAALSINNHGQIVGDYTRVDPATFFVTNAALLPDIQDFIPSTGSIYFSSLDLAIPMEEVVVQNNNLGPFGPALDNNDFGQIAGIGQDGGFTYLLTPVATPVPEPSTIYLLGSALAAICLWRRCTKSHS